MADALRLRDVPAAEARLAAEVGIAICKVAFERCMSSAKRRKLAVHLHETLAEFAAFDVAQDILFT